MSEVTLEQVLAEREARVIRRCALLDRYRCPVISFTMNIAGPQKISPLIERAFRIGCRRLDAALAPFTVRSRTVECPVTGCLAFYVVDTDADTLKAICTAIEEETPLGRLFDMDVTDTDGSPRSRTAARGCIVCGASGRACAALRRHTVAELQAATCAIITDFFARDDGTRIAAAAADALVREVRTTPKPGLVDCRNNGSHADMTVDTFLASANALTPYFADCFSIGRRLTDAPPDTCFSALREAGLAAEQTMYAATGGVNTHKGIIFSMGLLCGAIGRLWTPDAPIPPTERLLSTASELVRPAVEADFAAADGKTAGERLYLAHRLTGIRGEAADGFPALQTVALPAYTAALAGGADQNTAGILTLLHLLTTVEDTNLYHRGGAEGAAFAADYARRLLALPDAPTSAQLHAMDDAFIARNLSPGGCADLLALTYFLHALQNDAIFP